ncbi:MAG: molybdenum cofactor guanylyltransferase [Anaerolineales bacterium]|nr:molybdenum cofactor guanylyltransferase [Anaerolineales bacterium]MCB9126754.1 molybdenum cofactor guanylyltransferase [Ardenticatenales bacterium]
MSTSRPNPLPLSAAVLAGGASSRMGRDKSLLMLDGERLIERVVGRLAQVADERLVSTNHPERYPFLADRVRFVPDEGGTGQGPLAGIASLLAAATHDRVLIVATDMPCLNVALLRHMASLPTRADVVIPLLREGGHPETTHAIYHRTALPAIQRRLAAGQRRVTSFFEDVTVHTIRAAEIERFDPHHRSFVNANTPAEWEAVRANADCEG